MRKVVLAALALSAAPVPAWAQGNRAYFQECDGYPAPTKKGDGIVSGSYLFGMASRTEDIRRVDNRTFAPRGVAACDEALADPTLKPEFVLRRANLLQARAYYLARNDKFDDALATLASVEELLDASDPLVGRGIGLGNRLLHAFILIEMDRDAEALGELAAIERERPYSAQVRDTAMKMRLLVDSRLENHIALLREVAPTNPLAAFDGFAIAMGFGRFEDAVAFGSGLGFDLPRNRGGWTVDGEALFEYQRIEFQASFDGSMAYALLAMGDIEGSARRLRAAREALEVAMTPPPPPARGKKQKKSVERDYEARVVVGNRGKAALDRWEQLMVLRQEAEQLNVEQLFQRLAGFPKGSVPVLADLIARLGQEDAAVKQQLIAGLLETLHESRLKESSLKTDDFMAALPRPETPGTQVRFKRGGDGYFLSDSGYSRREMDGPDDWTIRFADDVASRETVEEFGMLAAAEETLKRGYDGFVIQSRRVLSRTTRVSGMYVGYGEYNSGREAQLRIRMVHGAELPADLAGAEWRIVPAAEIRSALSALPQKPER